MELGRLFAQAWQHGDSRRQTPRGDRNPCLIIFGRAEAWKNWELIEDRTLRTPFRPCYWAGRRRPIAYAGYLVRSGHVRSQ